MVRETKHLCVANLPQIITEKLLIEAFQRYGKIENIKIFDDLNNKEYKCASIEFNDIESASNANNAKVYLNGSEQQLITSFHEPGTIIDQKLCLNVDTTTTTTTNSGCSLIINNDQEQPSSSSFNNNIVNSMNDQQPLESINVASDQQQQQPGQSTDNNNDNIKSSSQ